MCFQAYYIIIIYYYSIILWTQDLASKSGKTFYALIKRSGNKLVFLKNKENVLAFHWGCGVIYINHRSCSQKSENSVRIRERSQTVIWTFGQKRTHKASCKQDLLPSLYYSNLCNMCGPIAWPPVLLLADFWRAARPNNFTLDTALWVLSNTPDKCEVDRMNGCRDNRRTDGQTDRDSSHL